jgi:hypothetical protein
MIGLITPPKDSYCFQKAIFTKSDMFNGTIKIQNVAGIEILIQPSAFQRGICLEL